MKDRPQISKQLDGNTFRNFYYLKEELVDFCRKNGLPVSGAKKELTDRIVHFLETGEILSPPLEKKKDNIPGVIRQETIIEPNLVCSQRLVGDGSGSGKMTMKKLSYVLSCITENTDVVGFTIAEYLPFDAHKLHNMFAGIRMFYE